VAEVTDSLDGVLVADFSRVLSGPTATMFLADLGADVVKVERPGVGDDTRAWGPPFLEDESTYFLSTNRNKRSVVLDLLTPEGLAAARELIRRADVVVENFRPGTMERLGLGYSDCAEVNPRLVYCSISGFGSGAGATKPGYDFIVQAMGGLMSITGEPEGPPMKVGVAMVDLLVGLHATIGILAGLRQAATAGKGGLVEVNLLSSMLSSLANQGSAFAIAGQVPQRLGNVHPSIAPYELFDAMDRQVAIACGTDRQFASLCRVLDREDLANDPRYATNRDRVENRPSLRRELEKAFAERSSDPLLAELDKVGVPAGPVNNLSEAFSLAESLGLEPVQQVMGPHGPIPQMTSPLRFNGEKLTIAAVPPRLGQHTQEILEWLGQPAEAPAATGAS
jgi:crotonobetainyl-CoA:carnitine CoA-transferase CaiB-like acyl-CoA transferase